MLAQERNILAVERTDLAELRTELARERTRATEERTLMAWIRTVLSMIGFGVGIDRLYRPAARESQALDTGTTHVGFRLVQSMSD